MAGGRIKGCFDSVEKLRQHHPDVLRRFLSQFPSVLEIFGIVLPDENAGEELPYAALCDMLMSARLPANVAVLLIIVSKLGNETGWHEIEHEANIRGVSLTFDLDGLSYSDRAIMAWVVAQPEHPDILEEAFARARIYSKSSYTYYPMTEDIRRDYSLPDAQAIAALESSLNVYFADSEKLGSGAKVLVYNYDAEVWFLVRHPGVVKREGVYEGSRATSVALTPELYDAVVYHKRYGDLRLNTHRKREHLRYRIDFGHLLFCRENVFHPTNRIIGLEPLKTDCIQLCRTGDIPGLHNIIVSEVCFFAMSRGSRRVVWRAEKQNESLPLEANNCVVPEDTDSILYAKFRYQLSSNKAKWHGMTVHTGKNLNYERDGDSCVLEEWLRRRGFIHGWPAI